MSYFGQIRKREAVEAAEAKGCIADSMDVRRGLLESVRLGEMSLPAAQAKLKHIKRTAKQNGLMTRLEVYNGG